MQTDHWTGKPHPVSNRNVPQDAEIVGQVSYTSGEIIETYYHKYNPAEGWHLWKVADWTECRPQRVSIMDIFAVITPPQEYMDSLKLGEREAMERRIARARATKG